MSLSDLVAGSSLGAPFQRPRQHDLRAVLKGATQVLAIRLAGAGLAYASMILLARWLGAFQFGIYAYIWVWLVVLMTPLSLGYCSAAMRFLPDYLARAKWEKLHGFIRQGYAVASGVSLLAGLAGASTVYAFRAAVSPHYFLPLLIGFFCLPISVLANQIEGVARAFGWVHAAFLPGYIMRPLIVMALVGGAYGMGSVPDATAALWALVAASIGTLLVQGMLVRMATQDRMPPAAPVYRTRRWAAISLSFVMIDGFRMLLENSDMLMLGKLLDPRSVAVYFAAARTANLIAFLYFAVVALAVPRFSKIRATGSADDLQNFFSGVVHLMFWPSLGAAIALTALGPFVLSLFGVDFEDGYWVLPVVLTGLVIRASVGPVEYLLNMTGHHSDTLWACGVAAAANVAMILVLVPAIGIIGAAISSAAALAGVSIWLAFMVRRRLNVVAFVFAPKP